MERVETATSESCGLIDETVRTGAVPRAAGREVPRGAKPEALPVNPDGIPAELKALPRWVCWRWECRRGKWTKPPIDARSNRSAASTDPSTWAEFDHALAAYQDPKRRLDGIGFVLTAKDSKTGKLIGEAVPFVGIDLDHCVDRNAETVDPRAAEIVRRADTYSERSPSGTGVRIIAKASLPGPGRKSGEAEVYETGRYLTMTGRRLPKVPEEIQPRQAEIGALYEELFPARLHSEPTRRSLAAHEARGGGLRLDADAVPPQDKIDLLKENSTRFRAAWEGKSSGRPDSSASGYDLTLAEEAVNGDWSDQEIADLLIAHRRRQGWDPEKALRPDYQARTICKAREGALPHAEGGQVEDPSELSIPPDCVPVAEPPSDESTDRHRHSVRRKLKRALGIEVIRVIEYLTEPRTYELVLREGSVQLGKIDGLMNLNRFSYAVAEACKRSIRPMKAPQWHTTRQLLLDLCEPVACGQEATSLGKLEGWLHEYLDRNPPVAQSDQAVARDAPLQIDGSIFIRAQKLKTCIDLHCGERIDKTELCRLLTRFGAEDKPIECGSRRAGNRTSRCYWKLPDHFRR